MRRAPVTPLSRQHLVLVVFWIFAIPTGMYWYPAVFFFVFSLFFFCFFFKLIATLFIYLFLAVFGSSFRARAFSSCGKRGPLFIAVRGPLTIAAPPVVGAQAPDAQAQQPWLTGPVAPRHVGSSQPRARTRVPCISRQTLNHCATREAPAVLICISLVTYDAEHLFI